MQLIQAVLANTLVGTSVDTLAAHDGLEAHCWFAAALWAQEQPMDLELSRVKVCAASNRRAKVLS